MTSTKLPKPKVSERKQNQALIEPFSKRERETKKEKEEERFQVSRPRFSSSPLTRSAWSLTLGPPN